MDPSRLRNASRALLLGVSVSTLALGGCQTGQTAGPTTAAAPVATEMSERALYDEALRSRDPRVVSSFLRQYPESGLVVSLLTSMPASALGRVSRRDVSRLPESTIRRLPPNVRAALGLGAVQAPRAARGSSIAY